MSFYASNQVCIVLGIRASRSAVAEDKKNLHSWSQCFVTVHPPPRVSYTQKAKIIFRFGKALFSSLLFISLSPSRDQIFPEDTVKLHIFPPSPQDLKDKYHSLSPWSQLSCVADKNLTSPFALFVLTIELSEELRDLSPIIH